MKIAFFSAHPFEKKFFLSGNEKHQHELRFFETSLNQQTAPLAKGFDCVCGFVNDKIDALTLESLRDSGIRLIALRCAGYNNVDMQAVERLDMRVVRVPAYSPHAVAEHAVALLLCLNRKIHKAHARVHDQNFSLDGLVGFDLFGKTVGVIGTGRIGAIFARIMKGFGCEVLAYDSFIDPALVEQKLLSYVSLEEIYRKSDVISLHLPLFPETRHMINAGAFAQMKQGVVLLNTGRGELIDSSSLIDALKSGRVGGACLDVYEEEEGVFFKDLSDRVLTDDVLARLLSFPNVLMTSHQAFLTIEALTKIAEVTLQNISDFKAGRALVNQVRLAPKKAD